jgi:hypothetical protein
MSRAILSILVFVGGTVAQAAANGVCALSGTVVDEVSGRAIAQTRVFVRLYSDDNRAYRMGRTDEQGRFCFERLDWGVYLLVAQRTGYLDSTYGAKPSGERGVGLPIRRDAELPPVTVKMTPRPILAGVVRDASGDPVANTTVSVWKRGWTKSEMGGFVEEDVQTDGRGAFRFSQLAPGVYSLSAGGGWEDRKNFDIPFLDAQGQKVREREIETFYPDSLTLGPGQQMTNLVLTIRKAPLRRLAGRVQSGADRLDGKLTVQLLDRRTSLITVRLPVQEDGSFSSDDLIPGRYLLCLDVGGKTVARKDVDLMGGDVEGLSIEPQKPFDVQLRLKMEDGGARASAPFRYMVYLGVARENFGREGRLQSDGSYRFRDLLPTVYDPPLLVDCETCYVKQVTVDGAIQAEGTVDLRSGGAKLVEMTIGVRVATVEGSVVGERKTASAVTVVLIDEARAGPEFLRSRRVVADQSGHFKIEGVRPGQYRLYAIEDFDEDLWNSPALREALAAKSVSIEMREGDQKKIDPKVISAREWAAVVGRLGL